jgi:hypothetical protein
LKSEAYVPDTFLRFLNWGGGRDSTAAICLLHAGKLVSRDVLLRPSDVTGIAFADPGYEWDHTYAAIRAVRPIIEDMGVPLYVIKKPPEDDWRADTRQKGERVIPAWTQRAEAEGQSPQQKCDSGAYHYRLPIVDEYERNEKITARASASCTTNHKVLPIRRLMDDLCKAKFGISTRLWYTRMRRGAPKHEVILGIAADEARRAIDTGRPLYEQVSYPLVDMGITKDDESKILQAYGLDWIKKSGCRNCHFQSLGWYAVLKEAHPDEYQRIVDFERVQIDAKIRDGATPMYLQGKGPIDEGVTAWRDRHPNATHKELLEKSYGRGGVFGGTPNQCIFEFGAEED